MAAARNGARRWAERYWALFLPIMAAVGIGRGAGRAGVMGAHVAGRVRRGGARMWQARGRAGARVDGWSKSFARLFRSSPQRAPFGVLPEFTAGLLPPERPATTNYREYMRERLNRLRAGRAVSAAEGDTREMRIADAAIRAGTRELAAHEYSIGVGPPPQPKPPRTPGTASAPTQRGDIRMSTSHGTDETKAVGNSFRILSDMDPENAAELSDQLGGLGQMYLKLADSLGDYIETLDGLKVDPRVTSKIAAAVEESVEGFKAMRAALTTYHLVYAAHFEAAESGAREINREKFWDVA